MTIGKSSTAAYPSSFTASSAQESPLLWAPLLAIGAAALAVEIPFFFLGTPSGHDVEFHLYSWLEVLSQWRQGILFPRWAELAHFGYGEPRFLFYPPASWTLGSILSGVLPWAIAASVYIWVALAAAGVSMFVLARRWMGRRNAIFAAVLYAVNPYHLVIVYWRSAFAELLASCLVPLLLLLVARAVDEEYRIVVPLALVLAAAWLTNAPAAIMIHYSLALLAALFAWHRRSPRLLLVGTAAVALGACLAAVYLLPAIYEQKWIKIAEAVSAGSRPQDNFLFIHTPDSDHDAFNRVISWVALLEIAVTATAAWAARSWPDKSSPEGPHARTLWRALIIWAAACAVLMFPATALLWKILPKLQFMQFPWRWLLCLSMILVLLVTLGVRHWWKRCAICALAILVIVAAWHRIQAPWWDNAADLREMQDNMETSAGYEGTDEYTPLEADPTAIDKDARKVTVEGPARAAIRVLRWDAELKFFAAEVSAPDRLVLRLFRYPAWKVEINGRMVETTAREDTGQMLVPVEAGMNRVQITFIRTWDRTAGGWISISAAVFVLLWSLRTRRSQHS